MKWLGETHVMNKLPGEAHSIINATDRFKIGDFDLLGVHKPLPLSTHRIYGRSYYQITECLLKTVRKIKFVGKNVIYVTTFLMIIPEAKVLLDTSYVESLRSSKARPCSRQLLYSWLLIIDAWIQDNRLILFHVIYQIQETMFQHIYFGCGSFLRSIRLITAITVFSMMVFWQNFKNQKISVELRF